MFPAIVLSCIFSWKTTSILILSLTLEHLDTMNVLRGSIQKKKEPLFLERTIFYVWMFFFLF